MLEHAQDVSPCCIQKSQVETRSPVFSVSCQGQVIACLSPIGFMRRRETISLLSKKIRQRVVIVKRNDALIAYDRTEQPRGEAAENLRTKIELGQRSRKTGKCCLNVVDSSQRLCDVQVRLSRNKFVPP